MDCLTIEVYRSNGESWGVQIAGEVPCYIASIQEGSPAKEAGLEVGDYIISVNGVSAYNASHKEVSRLIAESGKIIRFRILPGNGQQNNDGQSSNEEAEPEIPKMKKHKSKMKSHTKPPKKLEDSEKFVQPAKYSCKDEAPQYTTLKNPHDVVKSDTFNAREKKPSNMTAQEMAYEITNKFPTALLVTDQSNKEIEQEQEKFIVTRNNQKDFDETFEHEGNFAGYKATVAGAFTGEHNVILSEENDVRGIKSRVMAGIQHFSFPGEEKTKLPENDETRIILYTTSLGIYRTIAHKCEQARRILKGFRVKFEDRDIYNNPSYKEELFNKLGLSMGDKFPVLPRLYIDGVYVGSSQELQEMSDCGDLRIRLQDFPKYNLRVHCPTCKGTGIVKCSSCKGKCYRQKNRFARLKCGSCNEIGRVECVECI